MINRTPTEQELADKIIETFKQVTETTEEPTIVYLSVKESNNQIRLRLEIKGKINENKENPPPTLGVGVAEVISADETLGGK